MDYKVVITQAAEEDLDRFIQYLVFEKEINRQQKIYWMILKSQNNHWNKWLEV